MNVYVTVEGASEFSTRCDAAMLRVGRGTKKATTAMCEAILEESLIQVPKDTLTLYDSAYYEVTRRTGTAASSYIYEGVVGYGGNGDPYNPKSRKNASSYMVEVHEDLTAYHSSGKAKFLEDPILELSGTYPSKLVVEINSELALL